ncbi:hypothetical protein GCM10007242_15510 [Pigmentiphaga litoralis]|jgi:hypothetical protein|nr:hypothetical protein [Pigmentiphaga litoralis]GGX10392.1 hypothetical protein GCM10007242_15510 [Pigmentiphaga litoralis]
MKKTLLLASMLAIALSACGKKEEAAVPADTTPPAVTTPAPMTPTTPPAVDPAAPAAPMTPADPAAPATAS